MADVGIGAVGDLSVGVGSSASTAPQVASSNFESNVVRPRQWVTVPKTLAVQECIAQLEPLMKEVIHYTRFTNLGPDETGLNDEQRAHLIEILETTLAVLKAPMAEEGLFTEARSRLGRAMVRLGEEAPEKILYVTGTLAPERLDKIISLFGF